MSALRLAVACLLVSPAIGNAAVVNVGNVTELRAAVATAAAGDEIRVAPGTYAMTASLTLANDGTPALPIRLVSTQPQGAVLRSTTVEMLRVDASDWQIEGFVFEGACATDDQCEHALHVISGADRLLLRGNVLRDFNAPVKGNGEPAVPGGAYVFADDVRIEGNTFYATRSRQTANPVTFIDVVGGQRWIVADNFLYDFHKAQGNQISYGAFLKGNGAGGVFERNLVMCERNVTGGVRIGLSFGGGGTGASFCEGGDCSTEHRGGTLRNNLIVNCSDVGIYLNRAQATVVDHNTLFNTMGIDVRFATSSATLRNNVLGNRVGNTANGAIRARDGGIVLANAGNLVQIAYAVIAGWFMDAARGDFRAVNVATLVNQGVAGSGVTDDYCGDDRQDGAPDIGAIEYDNQDDCATVFEPQLFRNGFE